MPTSTLRVSVHGWSAPAAGRTTLTVRDTTVFELATLHMRQDPVDDTPGYLSTVGCGSPQSCGVWAGCGISMSCGVPCGSGCAPCSSGSVEGL